MVKFSRANLLQDELEQIRNSNYLGKLMHRFQKNTNVYFRIEIPNNLFLRGEVFCDDIQELAEMKFTQNDLMNLLYNDFLTYAKKHPEPRAILNLLISLERSGKSSELEQQQVKSVFKLVHRDVQLEMKSVPIVMRRKSALRGEILLADMEEVHPNHGYTLERVFELIYIDFIQKFRKGDNAAALSNILALLNDE